MAETQYPDRIGEMVTRSKWREPARPDVATALFAEHLDLAAIRLALGHKKIAQEPARPFSPSGPRVAPYPARNPAALSEAPPFRSMRQRRSAPGIRLAGAAALGCVTGAILGLLWFTLSPTRSPERAPVVSDGVPATTGSRPASVSGPIIEMRRLNFVAASPLPDLAPPNVVAEAPTPPTKPSEAVAAKVSRLFSPVVPLPVRTPPVRTPPAPPAPLRATTLLLALPVITDAPTLAAVRIAGLAPALSPSSPAVSTPRGPAPLAPVRIEATPAPPRIIASTASAPTAIVDAPPPRPDATPAEVFVARNKAPIVAAPRVVVHYSAARPAPAHAPVEASLRAVGVQRVEWRAVPFRISQTNARFFHAADRRVTGMIVAAVEGSGYAVDTRDFTHFTPPPTPGTIELWLAR